MRETNNGKHVLVQQRLEDLFTGPEGEKALIEFVEAVVGIRFESLTIVPEVKAEIMHEKEIGLIAEANTRELVLIELEGAKVPNFINRTTVHTNELYDYACFYRSNCRVSNVYAVFAHRCGVFSEEEGAVQAFEIMNEESKVPLRLALPFLKLPYTYFLDLEKDDENPNVQKWIDLFNDIFNDGEEDEESEKII